MELDIDKLQRSIKACAHHPEHDCRKCEYSNDKLWCYNDKLLSDFDKIIDMLKEQEEQKQKWLQNIADNQLAIAPTETMDATTHTFYDGVWNGLQMAYEIITEGDETGCRTKTHP